MYYVSRLEQNDKQFVTRVDHNISDKLRIYASYIYDQLQQPSTTIASNVLTAVPDQSWTSQNLALNATYTFRSNLLATFVGSVSRRTNSYTGPTEFPDWPDLGVSIPKLVTQGSKSSLNLTIGNYFSLAWNGFYTIPATSANFGMHWTYIAGSHTFEFGADVIKSKVVKNQDFLRDGSYTFSGALSVDNSLDFLLSWPSSFTQREDTTFRFAPSQAPIVDTWKAARGLTLTLGLRWNPFVPMFAATYHQEGVFSSTAYNLGVGSTLTEPASACWSPEIREYPTILSRRIIISFCRGLGLLGIPSAIAGPVSAPDVRYAYQTSANTFNPGYSPFTVNATYAFPVSTENPYQGQYNPFPVPHPHPPSLIFPLPMAAQPFTFGLKDSLIQQWNLTVERQLPWSALLRVAYEGESADHLPGGIEGNAAIYNPALSAAANRTAVNSRRPMGQYYQGLILGENIGTSSFNALNVSVEKRMTQGLTFLSGYRWSSLTMRGCATYRNAYSSTNPHFDRGPCVYDVRHQFHFSYWRIRASTRWSLRPR